MQLFTSDHTVVSLLLLLLALVPVAGLLRVLQRYLTKSPLDNLPGPLCLAPCFSVSIAELQVRVK